MIEDDEIFAGMYARWIEIIGPCELAIAKNWDEAFRLCRLKTWDIILTDNCVPGCCAGAEEFCRRVRKEGYVGKIIVCSGAWKLTREEVQDWGADDLWLKGDPCEFKKLFKKFLEE
ncbi:MAG: response regulator [Candidatus Magasanikbacteria bacterium]|nr:response regulator [Candidatus Magasanikbacteria bacterium]